MSDGSDSWLIVGLGNPGSQYAATRHNAGYAVIEVLASKFGIRLKRHRRAHADSGDGRIGNQRVTLLRTRTFMNQSGGAVKGAALYAKLPVSQLVVIHDDLDLGLGSVKLKCGGGDGGHNGLKSIRQAFASGDFYRVRIGIGRPPGRQDAADFVLRPFSSTQRSEFELVAEIAADAVAAIISEPLSDAQNRFNAS